MSGRAGTAFRARLPLPGEFHAAVVEVGDKRHFAAAEGEYAAVRLRDEVARQLAAHPEQLAVERVGVARVELRAEEGLERLRVGDVLAGEARERLEHLLASLAR